MKSCSAASPDCCARAGPEGGSSANSNRLVKETAVRANLRRCACTVGLTIRGLHARGLFPKCLAAASVRLLHPSHKDRPLMLSCSGGATMTRVPAISVLSTLLVGGAARTSGAAPDHATLLPPRLGALATLAPTTHAFIQVSDSRAFGEEQNTL